MRLVKRPLDGELGRTPEATPEKKFTNWAIQFKKEAAEELERREQENLRLLELLRRL